MRTLLYLTLGLSAGCAAAGVRQATPAPAPAAASAAASQAAAESMSVDRAQYPSTYRRHPNPPVLIRNADRKSTRLNSSHDQISYAVFCLKKKKKIKHTTDSDHTPITRQIDRLVVTDH